MNHNAASPTSTARELEAALTRYFESRFQQAGAITPGQKLAIINEVERELDEEGKVIIASGPVRVNVNSPAVQAALAGRTVVLSGKQVTTHQARGTVERLQAQPVWVRLLLLASLPLGFLVVCGVMFLVRGQAQASASMAATPTMTVTVTVGPLTPTATLLPEPTATPYALALTTGDAAPSANDPASVEIAGFSYVLGVGEVENGEWTPQAAEWLADTHLHRVIAVPWEPNLANAVSALRPGMLLTVRLRSGELAKYKIGQVGRVQRQQIELLTGRTPGLSVVLYGEPSDQRTVIVAVALQEAGDLSGYTAVDPLPEASPSDPPPVSGSAEPTLLPEAPPVPGVQTVMVTDTLSLAHLSAGITLTVLGCDRMSEVQGQPAPSREEYLVCEVELHNSGNAMVRFSDQAFGITERAWWEARPDWMPTVNVSVTDALGAGTFAPESRTQGRLVGLVTRPGGGINGRRSDPVLVWYQDAVRYLIALPQE
jgi:hypothetical protein